MKRLKEFAIITQANIVVSRRSIFYRQHGSHQSDKEHVKFVVYRILNDYRIVDLAWVAIVRVEAGPPVLSTWSGAVLSHPSLAVD
jgi:hypothetical protein